LSSGHCASCLRGDWRETLATGASGEPAASFAVTTVMPSMLRAGLISKENERARPDEHDLNPERR
jgi:hypothetical protein